MKILIATGGSGGHIFPALQTAAVLKQRGHEVFFAGALKLAEEKIRQAGFAYQNMEVRGWQDRSLKGIVAFGMGMAAAFAQAMGICRRFQPDRVMGFGGYSSFPVLLAASIQRFATMIHEQNVVPGKANRLLSYVVHRIAISFKDSAQHFPAGKTVWTGCPCHQRRPVESRDVLRQKFGLDPQAPVVALLGGSQGSQRLNEVFFETMRLLNVQRNIQAVHMTGPRDHAAYVRQYQEAKIPAAVFAFISPIEELYALVNLVISRAGAATVSELGHFALPSILVPYPFAGNHQRYNAEVLARTGAAKLIEQKDLNPEKLKSTIEWCLRDNEHRHQIQERVKGLFIEDAAVQLALAVENL